jgi:hypothetical protein
MSTVYMRVSKAFADLAQYKLLLLTLRCRALATVFVRTDSKSTIAPATRILHAVLHTTTNCIATQQSPALAAAALTCTSTKKTALYSIYKQSNHLCDAPSTGSVSGVTGLKPAQVSSIAIVLSSGQTLVAAAINCAIPAGVL